MLWVSFSREYKSLKTVAFWGHISSVERNQGRNLVLYKLSHVFAAVLYKLGSVSALSTSSEVWRVQSNLCKIILSIFPPCLPRIKPFSSSNLIHITMQIHMHTTVNIQSQRLYVELKRSLSTVTPDNHSKRPAPAERVSDIEMLEGLFITFISGAKYRLSHLTPLSSATNQGQNLWLICSKLGLCYFPCLARGVFYWNCIRYSSLKWNCNILYKLILLWK